MNLIPLRNFLLDKVQGESIFVFHMPFSVKTGVLLLHNLNGAKLDCELPGYKKAKFQAIVRSSNFETGYQLSKDISKAFQGAKRITLDGVFYYFIKPIHDPVAFPTSAGDNIEFSVNYETIYIEN
jgi:Bacteriophage minor capsid protein